MNVGRVRPAETIAPGAPSSAWALIAVLFFTLFFIFGAGYNTAGVFFTPVIRTFGWSRARLSTLQTALALAAGVSAPLVGWILDRIEARFVMAVGAVVAGVGFVAASLAYSYGAMVAAYLLIGLGVGAATLLPCSMVIANWFGARRGLAMGLTMAGTSVGGMVMTLVSDRAIRLMGWRLGYLVLATPVLVVVVPLVLLVVRTRPQRGQDSAVAQTAATLPGMEVGAALSSRSFWMLAAATLCFAVAVSGTNLHTVPYLIGVGYAPARAAFVLSLMLACGGMGKLLIGWIADRSGARPALAAALLGMALGISLLKGARHEIELIGFVMAYGITFGGPLALLPLVMAESLGLKRFGSLYGLIGFFHTMGSAAGPIIAGRVFDLDGSYSYAFEAFVILLIIGSAAALACAPLPTEHTAPSPAAARA
jgi:MFS family permease